MQIPLQDGEQIIADVAANLFRGAEAVGGRLKITDRRLLFQPHAINLQTTPAEIPISQISEMRPRNTLGIVPNGMLVKLQSGVEYKFVVWKRQQLMATIDGLRAKKSA
jgi:hypothetical protein